MPSKKTTALLSEQDAMMVVGGAKCVCSNWYIVGLFSNDGIDKNTQEECKKYCCDTVASVYYSYGSQGIVKCVKETENAHSNILKGLGLALIVGATIYKSQRS